MWSLTPSKFRSYYSPTIHDYILFHKFWLRFLSFYFTSVLDKVDYIFSDHDIDTYDRSYFICEKISQNNISFADGDDFDT